MAHESEWEPVAGAPVAADKREDAQFRLTRLDNQIKIEFELIGHRMTWLIVSQSFLFAAFATAAISVASGRATPSPPAGWTLSWNLVIPSSLLLLLPVVGIVSALAADQSTDVARSVIRKLKKLRDILESDLNRTYGYDILGVATWSREHNAGHWPSKFLPKLLMCAWVLLLMVRLIVGLMLYV